MIYDKFKLIIINDLMYNKIKVNSFEEFSPWSPNYDKPLLYFSNKKKQ
jgi:hypothetical protein